MHELLFNSNKATIFKDASILNIPGVNVRLANGKVIKNMNKHIYITFMLKEVTLGFSFIIMPELIYDFILGTDFMYKYSCKIDFSHFHIIFRNISAFYSSEQQRKETNLTRGGRAGVEY